MEENASPVQMTPTGGGGGSGEVNDVSNVNGSVVMKRKRGRPKKLPVEAQSVMVISSTSPQLGFHSPNSIQPPLKRGRGRPKGSCKARRGKLSPPPASGFGEGETYGYGEELKPHILQIYTGEDVHGRILSFAQKGNQAITVLSCTGPVARISICSLGSAGGMIYEGVFEILTLNGTFKCDGPEGSYHHRGMLTACLAKPNGDVFGGYVSGPIIAAGPIQLILCSFEQGRRPSNIQLRSYSVPHLPEPAPSPTPSQVTVAKASDNFQQADTLISSDPRSTDAPVSSVASDPKDEQVSTPFLHVPSSPQPNIEARVIEVSFENENPDQ